MFFGNADARLIYKLSKVREKTTVVVETLNEFEDWEVAFVLLVKPLLHPYFTIMISL
jgi:hypothetical protein